MAKVDANLSKSRSTMADNLSSMGFAFPSSAVSFLSWTYWSMHLSAQSNHTLVAVILPWQCEITIEGSKEHSQNNS